MKCHDTGVGGAPRIGDRADWTPRIKRGLDAVVASAIHGHGAMPPRGGMADLTDVEIRSAIVYMFNAGTGQQVRGRARPRESEWVLDAIAANYYMYQRLVLVC